MTTLTDDLLQFYDNSKDRSQEITRWPWRWEFLGTAGNYFLVGSNGVTYGGPDSADGRVKQAAPELLQVCKELAAWLTIEPEFQDWPAAQSRLAELNRIIARADSTYLVPAGE